MFWFLGVQAGIQSEFKRRVYGSHQQFVMDVCATGLLGTAGIGSTARSRCRYPDRAAAGELQRGVNHY
jgi:hypothetical protein